MVVRMVRVGVMGVAGGGLRGRGGLCGEDGIVEEDRGRHSRGRVGASEGVSDDGARRGSRVVGGEPGTRWLHRERKREVPASERQR